jgi:hypothetical protein
MDGHSERLIEQMTQAERACAALDRTIREMRRFQREARPVRAIPALARPRVLADGGPAADGDATSAAVGA